MEAENGFSLIFVSSILREIAPDFVLIGNEGIGLVTRPSRPHFQMREIRMRIAFGVIFQVTRKRPILFVLSDYLLERIALDFISI